MSAESYNPGLDARAVALGGRVDLASSVVWPDISRPSVYPHLMRRLPFTRLTCLHGHDTLAPAPPPGAGPQVAVIGQVARHDAYHPFQWEMSTLWLASRDTTPLALTPDGGVWRGGDVSSKFGFFRATQRESTLLQDADSFYRVTRFVGVIQRRNTADEGRLVLDLQEVGLVLLDVFSDPTPAEHLAMLAAT